MSIVYEVIVSYWDEYMGELVHQSMMLFGNADDAEKFVTDNFECRHIRTKGDGPFMADDVVPKSPQMRSFFGEQVEYVCVETRELR